MTTLEKRHHPASQQAVFLTERYAIIPSRYFSSQNNK
jgi:hypothetical protein